jgi:hypothetical protein
LTIQWIRQTYFEIIAIGNPNDISTWSELDQINFSLVYSILAVSDFQTTLSQCLDGGLQAQDLLLSILKNCVEYGMEKVSNTKGMFNLFQVSYVFCLTLFFGNQIIFKPWKQYLFFTIISLGKCLFKIGTPPLTRFLGTQKNRVKGKPRYRRTKLVLKWENGTF